MDAVEDIKQKLSIEDVIGQYVELKRSGRNFKGLSPFSNEKTPSFIVSPEKQIWHDFSSGKGGDMFSFIMEAEGLDFKGALDLLARKAGIDLSQYTSSRGAGDGQLKKRLSEALALAAKFYQKQLAANPEALDYLRKKRAFSRETILTWQLGYSPNTGQALHDFLTKKGFTTQELKQAGLITQRYQRSSDMFRGRIMIPLCDQQGNVVGFTARQLEDEPNSPKYINTPQTPLYDKSSQVFGLHLAKEQMRKQKFVVVVEGNLDVISSHQAEITNVVASAGTAMTEQHLKALNRFTGDIRLSFDADQAGLNATERVIPLAQKVGVSLSIITIPEGKDPDELIKKDPKLWEKAIAKPEYVLDWLIEQYAKRLDITTAQGKRQFTDTVLATIRRLSDPVEQEHYIRKTAEMIGSSEAAVAAKLKLQPSGVPKPRLKSVKPTEEPSQASVEYQKLQDHFLAMTLLQPKLRPLLHTAKADFFDEGPRRQLFQFLRTHPDFGGEAAKAKELHTVSDYVKILVLHFEELYAELPYEQLQLQATRLKTRLIMAYVTTRKRHLAQAMRQTIDQAQLADYMQQVNDLNNLIKHS